MIFHHHNDDYWSHEHTYGSKLSEREIDHVTLYMTFLRREIIESEKMIKQNVKLIREGEKLLKDREINLPKWHDGDTESEKFRE